MKKINYFKLIKLFILTSAMYVILFKPEVIMGIVNIIVDYLLNSLEDKSITQVLLDILVKMLVIIIFFKIIKTLFGKWYYRVKLKHSNMKQNTYSKGNAKFQKEKELKRSFAVVEYGKHNTDGYIVGQYKEYNVLGLNKTYYPHYEMKEGVNYGTEELSNAEQINYLISNMKDKKLSKEDLDKFLSIKKMRNVLMIDNNPIHMLVIATTRAGKTQTLVLPQIDYLSSIREYSKKPHMIMSDPKGEIFENTAKDLEERGYEILVINLKDFSKSHSYNPLNVIADNHQEELNKFNWNQENVDNIVKTEFNNIFKSLEMQNDVKETNECKFILNNQADILTLLEDKSTPNIKIFEFLKDGVGEHSPIYKSIKSTYEMIYIKELEKYSFAKSETEIDKFSNYLLPDQPGDSPIWINGARSIFSAYVKYLWEMSFMYGTIDSAFNLYALMTELQKGDTEVPSDDPRKPKTLFQLELEKRSSSHYSKLQHPASFTNDTYKGQMESLKTSIRVFQNFDVGRLVSKHQFDFHKIVKGDKPYGIYLITPDYDTTYNFIVSTFISQLYLTAVEDAEKYYGGKLPRKMHFILDEFANIPKIDQLTPKMTVCLGRGIQFLLVVQNKQQLISVYGEDDATTILDNTHNKMFLLAGDGDTREWFSSQLGSTTILSQSYSGKEVDEMSMTTSEEEKKLVSPYELNKNPLGQVYGSIVKQDPVRNKLRPAFQYLQINKTNETEFFASSKHNNLHNEIKHNNEITL